MSAKYRREVLRAFKGLHRARTTVFEGDQHALQVTRAKINEEFQKNKHIDDEKKIAELIADYQPPKGGGPPGVSKESEIEMIKFSNDVETELRTTVVQAREVEPNKYEVRFRDETVRMDNYPYQDVPEEILLAHKKKGGKTCKDKENT